MRSGRAVLVLLALTLISLASCGADDDTTDSTPPTTEEPSPAAADERATTSTEGPSPGSEVPICPPGGCEVEEAWRVPYAADATNEEVVDIIGPIELGPWPVVVLAHGIDGSRSDLVPLARDIASHGAVAVVVDYPDAPPFIEAIEHLGCSVRFARSIAEDHGGDPDDVTLFGHSLGAAMGAVVALDDDLSIDHCLANDGSTAPEAFVGYEGPYDIAVENYVAIDITSLEADDPEVWRSVNPYSNVGRHSELVVRLIHGVDEDRHWFDVQPHVSEDFYRALLDAGYDVELVMIDGASHGAIGSGSEAFERTVAEVMEAARV